MFITAAFLPRSEPPKSNRRHIFECKCQSSHVKIPFVDIMKHQCILIGLIDEMSLFGGLLLARPGQVNVYIFSNLIRDLLWGSVRYQLNFGKFQIVGH